MNFVNTDNLERFFTLTVTIESTFLLFFLFEKNFNLKQNKNKILLTYDHFKRLNHPLRWNNFQFLKKLVFS